MGGVWEGFGMGRQDVGEKKEEWDAYGSPCLLFRSRWRMGRSIGSLVLRRSYRAMWVRGDGSGRLRPRRGRRL